MADLYAQLRAIDDRVRGGETTLMELYDDPLVRMALSRMSRQQVYTATVLEREGEPEPEPAKKQPVPVRKRRKSMRRTQ